MSDDTPPEPVSDEMPNFFAVAMQTCRDAGIAERMNGPRLKTVSAALRSMWQQAWANRDAVAQAWVEKQIASERRVTEACRALAAERARADKAEAELAAVRERAARVCEDESRLPAGYSLDARRMVLERLTRAASLIRALRGKDTP